MSEVTAVPIRPIAKGSVTKLWVGLGLLFVAALVLVYIGQRPIWTPSRNLLYANGKKPGVVTLAGGVQILPIAAGQGESPKKDDVVLIDYRGTLADGAVFDEQKNAALGLADLVPGFTEGLTHMQKGGSYKLWIPPELGYGAKPRPGIPANSVLQFDITLRDFKTQEEIARLQQQMQQMQQLQGGAGGMPGGPPHGAGGGEAPPLPGM